MSNKLVPIALTTLLLSNGAALAIEPIEVCYAIATSAAKNVGLKTSSTTWLQTIHDKYCEENGTVKSSAKSFGLSIPEVPISLSLGASDSETKIKNFCSNYKSDTSQTSNDLDYKSIVVDKSLDAANQCMQIATKSKNAVSYTVITPEMLSIKFDIASGQTMNVMGVSHDTTVSCEGSDISNPGKTIVYNVGVGQSITAASGSYSISCTRKPYAEKDGAKFFTQSGLVVSTNSGALDIFWPQERIFPINSATELNSNINKIEDKISQLEQKVNFNILPIGSIIPWFEKSKSPPAGWAKCDGSDLTQCPDLRGLFLMGSGSDEVSARGGGEKLKITIASGVKIPDGAGWNEGGKNYTGWNLVDVPKPPYTSVLYIKKISDAK